MGVSIAVWSVLAGILGTAIGSFLNVVIYRLPAGLSVSHPPSHCPSCKNLIRNRHNVPVLGWLSLRGRCYDCKAPISARYPLVEAVTGIVFAAATASLLATRNGGWLPAALATAAAVITFGLMIVDGNPPSRTLSGFWLGIIAVLAVSAAMA